MSLAALGCNPEQTWTEADGTDGPGDQFGGAGLQRRTAPSIYVCLAKAAD